MSKVLVLYYSSYGHIETMAKAVAEGAASVAGTEVAVKRVPELIPEEVAKRSGIKLEQDAAVATVDELPNYDAIIFGTPTRFGMMATQHGGQEATLLSFHTSLLHHGMVIAGLPYSFGGQTRLDEVTGGSPYGATTIAGGDGSRQPSENELEGARFQGAHVARLAAKLSA